MIFADSYRSISTRWIKSNANAMSALHWSARHCTMAGRRSAFGFGTVVFAEESGAGAPADDAIVDVVEVGGCLLGVRAKGRVVIELLAQGATDCAEA